MFQRALDDELISLNPFDRLSVPVPRVAKDWHYIRLVELEKLLTACPTVGRKALIALCRLAGLRRGEAIDLRWSEVDWHHSRITVTSTKTQRHGKAKRVVPMQSRLREILREALDRATDLQGRVCEVNRFCLWRNFTVIRRHAALPDWDDAFQVMRRNCETDWAQKFPQHAVSEWLGHDIRVSAEFYLAVPEELYAKAANAQPAISSDSVRPQSAPNLAPKSSEMS